jgi:hypothetical protein
MIPEEINIQFTTLPFTTKEPTLHIKAIMKNSLNKPLLSKIASINAVIVAANANSCI